MDESTSKEKVLKKIRNALINKTNNPFPDIDLETSVYTDVNENELDIRFAEEFSKVAGKFVFNENHQELITNLRLLVDELGANKIFCKEEKIKELLSRGGIPFSDSEDDFLQMQIGITFCEFLIARLGSIMVSSKQKSGRRLVVYPPVHVVIAYTSQLVPDLKHAIAGIRAKYENKIPSMISVITGPSRTADIEKTLVMGAHGPKELYVFLVDDTSRK